MSDSIEIRAYTAGFFDGEGCISIRVRTSRKRNCVSVNVSMAQKYHIGPLKLIQGFYGGHISKNKGNCSILKLRNSEIEPFLLGVIPYLIVKKEQAVLALEVLKDKEGLGHNFDPNLKLKWTQKATKIKELKRTFS